MVRVPSSRYSVYWQSIDYVVFDGHIEAKDQRKGEVKVVLMDVKHGPSADLTWVEKLVKDAVDEGRGEWKTLRIEYRQSIMLRFL